MSTPKEVGNKYFREKKYGDAVAEYTRAILAINSSPVSNKKELAVLCGNRAECFIRLEQYEDGLKDCIRCTESDPANVKGHYRKGICLLSLNEYNDALLAFKEAGRLDPSNPQITNQINEIDKILNRIGAIEKSAAKRSSEDQYIKFPVSLKYGEDKGRIVYASRDIQEGETVLRVKGVASVLEDSLMQTHCSGCFVDIAEEKGNPKQNLCPKCQRATFCNNCMQVPSHRLAHEEECPLMQQIFSEKSNYVVENSRDQRLLFRLLLLHLREKEGKQGNFREGHKGDFVVDSYLYFNYIYSHFQTILTKYIFSDVQTLSCNITNLHPMQIQAFGECASVVIDVISKLSKTKIDLNIEDVVLMQGAILQNAHEISDPLKQSPSGIGLFPSAAYLNHSCRPNCTFYADNEGFICFKCVRKISKGEELCPSYIDILRPTRERQKQLMDQYCFNCQCERCTENEEDEFLEGCLCDCGGLLCQFEQSNEDIQNQIYECFECQKRTKLMPYVELEDEIIELYEKAKEFDPPDVELIAQALTKADTKLHRFHFMKCVMRRTLADIEIKTNQWSKAVSDLTELLAAYSFIFPDDPFIMGHELGRRYYQLAKAMKETGHQKAGETAKLVTTILNICVGNEHRVLQRVKNELLET